MRGASNGDIHLYPPTTSRQFIWQQPRTCGALGVSPMEFGAVGQPHKTPHFHPRHQHPPTPEWPSQEEPGSGLATFALVLDVSAPACTNGVWPPLRPVSVAQKNKRSPMLSSNVQSIDLLMDCTTWQFWTMRQSNGCSTPASRSSAAKQWLEQLARKKKKENCAEYFEDPTKCPTPYQKSVSGNASSRETTMF